MSLDDELLNWDNLRLAYRKAARGLPIGNLTSQWWANCYLNPFDHFARHIITSAVRRKCKAALGCSAEVFMMAG